VAEADKLTLGQELTVYVLYSILTLMQYKEVLAHMVKYQSMLCENPHFQLEVIKTPNLATLLLVDLGIPDDDCLEVMDEVVLRQLDLTDQHIGHSNVEYITDGSSYVREGNCFCQVFSGSSGLSH
jgi:hypothetical protein